MRSTSTGSALGSVTMAETRLIGTTVLSATSPNLEPSARTMIRSVLSSAARMTPASWSSRSVIPRRTETPAEPMTATSVL